MPTAVEIAAFLDARLHSAGFPDYAQAHNGLQLDHRGPVRRVTSAVDFSMRTIEGAIAAGANMLLLHHGLFWGQDPRLIGLHYQRIHRLIANDVAVYASHLPLDAHSEIGNCALLARALGLEPHRRFGEYRGASIGVAGDAALSTRELEARVDVFASHYGNRARASEYTHDRMTLRWAVLTGAGADAESLRLAEMEGVDTLIVGEGPHYTTIDAPERGVVVIYGGHYATETLGVRALGLEVERQFGVPSSFLAVPTGS